MTARVNPDTPTMVRFTLGLVALLGLVSFAVSFAGLSAVAQWAVLPHWLYWAMPVFIDGALVAYTMAYLIERARGESTWSSRTALFGFTAISWAANVAHVLGTSDLDQTTTWVGAFMAGVAPIGVLAATHTVARIAVAPVARAKKDWVEQEMDSLAQTQRSLDRFIAQRDRDVADLVAVAQTPRLFEVQDPPRSRRLPDDIDAEIARTADEHPEWSHRQVAAAVGVSKSTVTRRLAARDGGYAQMREEAT